MNIKAYVDGSYRDGKVGWGLVIVKNDELYANFSGTLTEDEVQGTRQVAGELQAVMEAVFWAKEQGIKELNLYYDYVGIKAWVTGVWKAKKELTQKYRDYMKESDIKVNFNKVKSHSGDKFNDMADKLARSLI